MTRAALLAPPLVLVLAGCGGNQNTIAPAGHDERAITQLFWVMLGVACVGFGVIVTLLFLGWLRRERPSLPGGRGERAATGVVIGLGVALPIVLLVALFVWSDLVVVNSVAAPTKPTPVTVRVIGHQWWWEVRYPATRASSPRTRSTSRSAHRVTSIVHDGRRDPQLLGAGAEPEGRHDPRARPTGCCSRPTARRLPRPVRRVLRAAARAHGRRGRRRAAGAAYARGSRTRAPARRAAARAGRRLRSRRLRRLPHDPRHAGARRASGPT